MTEITVQDAKLQDIPVELIKHSLEDIRGFTCASFDAAYGIRRDDGRLAVHFFPPGYAADMRVSWADWHRVRDAIEAAVLDLKLNTPELEAGYVEELKSFFLIFPVPSTLVLNAWFRHFFEIAARAAGTGTASETKQ